MKILINTSIAMAFVLSLASCGSSSDSAPSTTSDNVKSFDLWDYISSGDSSYTVYYDTVVEENGTVESTAVNDSRRDITETDTSIVQYRVSGSTTSRYQYLKNDNNVSISVVDYNSTMIRFLDINDTIYDINYTSNGYDMNIVSKVTNHYDTYSLRMNYGTFNDVLEITDTVTIDGNSTYYSEDKSYIAKGIGSIGTINRDCFVLNDANTSYYLMDSEESCNLLERITYDLRH